MCPLIREAVAQSLSRRRFLKGMAGAAAGGAAMSMGIPEVHAEDLSRRRKEIIDSIEIARPYRTRLVTLGTSGGPDWWKGAYEREGIASAVVVEDAVYLIDCGFGVGRRLTQASLGPESSPHSMENLNGIFLTHLHSDHISDYFNLFLYSWYSGLGDIEEPVHVYGPGDRGQLQPIFQLPGQPKASPPVINPENPTPGTVDMTNYLYQAFATDINGRMRDNLNRDLRTMFDVHDVQLPDIDGFVSPNETPAPDMAPFKVFEDDRVRVTATLVYHAPVFPALAYRFDSDDGAVVFSGDTGPSDNLIRLAKGANTLVHEVIDAGWVASIFPPPLSDTEAALRHHLLSSHTTIEQVGTIAQEADVETLVLTHIVPGFADRARLLGAQRNFSGQVIVGEDLMQFGIG